MAKFIWLSRSPRSKPLLPGVKALAAIIAVAVLLTVGQITLQARMVEAQITQAELQSQAEQARAGLQAQMEQARIEAEIQAQNVAADRAVLVEFYNATGGASWTNNTNWLSATAPLDDWFGITTNTSGRVTRISLPQQNMTGTLPASLGQLDLVWLALYGNSLTGTIPPELGNLTRLRHLALYNNDLTGIIPPSLGNLTNMENLALGGNRLMGPVPDALGGLNSMTTLNLSANQLTGELPLNFAGLSALTDFRFGSNAGLCAPLDSAFQTWLQSLPTGLGDNCPPTRIWTSTAAPVVGESVTVELTAREARLTRLGKTQQEYEDNPCIGYDSAINEVRPDWHWERADAASGDPSSPDDTTWTEVFAGVSSRATFVYLPGAGDVGKFLRATMTYGDSPSVEVTTPVVGPVVASNGLTSGDIVSVAAPTPTGTLQVGDHLNVTLPAAVADERLDRAINPRPAPWQWERSLDGSTGWDNFTPYHRHCRRPDSEFALHASETNQYLRAYIYYNDDSSGSVVLKQALSAAAGPVAAQ